jgi:hypothetical protein
METPTANSPARPGLFRRLFSWRTFRKALFVLAALITVGALLLAEEDWRGSRAWANYKRDMEAKGERFDMARLIPPKVPDDQNFAMTPYFAPLFDLSPEELRQPIKFVTNMFDGTPVVQVLGLVQRGTNLATYVPVPDPLNLNPQDHPVIWPHALAADLIGYANGCKATNAGGDRVKITDPVQAASIILDHFKPCEPTLAELRKAAARPYSQFNIPWEEWGNQHVGSAVIQHLAVVKSLCQLLALHAESEMVLGRTGQALDDLNTMFRMDLTLAQEPVLISQLVRFIEMTMLLHPIGEGLAEQRWSEPQLQVLQNRLQTTDLLASTVRALYGERDIIYNPRFDQGYMMPRGWNRLEQLNVIRAFQESILPRIDLAAREINPSVNHSIDSAFQASHAGTGFSLWLHHNMMATMTIPVFQKVPQKAALSQSGVDMAMLACALERYRLARGQYPEELKALVPDFAAVLPHDIINGQPLKYRRTDNGRFLLYSVGWNEKDDGGVVATKGNPPRQDTEQGDWVWQYPEKP